MNRSKLAYLLVIAAALNFSGCGGAAESAGGDGKKAVAASNVNATSPTPASNVATDIATTPADTTPATPAPAASGGVATPATAASPAAESRGTRAAPPSKMPTPQIGSGGNDLFLFTRTRAAIDGDPDLKASNLVIEVKEGVVTLVGTVASAALKSKAEELARGAGPKGVRNQLRVSAGK